MGKILVDKDFILFRPERNYRTNANVILLRCDPPVILETGTHGNPSIKKIQEILSKYGYHSQDIKYIIISHNHQDHFENLNTFRRYFKSARVIAPYKGHRVIRYPFLLTETWKKGLYYYGMSKFFIHLYQFYYLILSNFYFRSLQLPTKLDYTIDKEMDFFLSEKTKLKFIMTPGHSDGHIVIRDEKKNIYLGDFVAFTPWIEPSAEGLNAMINSLYKILEYDTKKIKRAIRAHGDTRRYPHTLWEIDSWENERGKFKFFLETILHTLDILPHYMRARPLSAEEITALIIPHYRKYSKIMSSLFIPPSITWGIAYAMKLVEEGEIRIFRKGRRFYWGL